MAFWFAYIAVPCLVEQASELSNPSITSELFGLFNYTETTRYEMLGFDTSTPTTDNTFYARDSTGILFL